MKSTTLPLLLLVAFSGLRVKAIFQRVPPILWAKSERPIRGEHKNYLLDIYLASPCELIGETLDGFQRSNSTRDVCSAVYEDEIVKSMELLEFYKQTRGSSVASSAEFTIAGVYRNMEAKERIVVASSSLEPEAQLAAIQQAIEGHAKTVVQDKVAITDRPIFLKSIWPRILLTRMHSSAGQINYLISSVSAGKIDFNALAELSGAEWLRQLDESTSILRNLKWNPVDSPRMVRLQLNFTAQQRSSDTSAYLVLPFRIWTDLAGEHPKLLEYGGPRNLIYNRSINCIMGIEDSFSDSFAFRREFCNIFNHEDTELSTWFALKESWDSYGHTTQVFESKSGSFIYCYGLHIRIDGETHECPSYPFYLSNLSDWISGDGIARSRSSVHRLKIDIHVHPVHFRGASHLFGPEDAQLVRENRRLKVDMGTAERKQAILVAVMFIEPILLLLTLVGWRCRDKFRRLDQPITDFKLESRQLRCFSTRTNRSDVTE